VVVGLGLCVAYAIPEAARRASSFVVMPDSLREWVVNFAILGCGTSSARLIPPAWSLSVELQLYLAMALALSSRRWVVVGWFVSSLLYTGYLVDSGANLFARYVAPTAASLPFSIGSMIYHFRNDLPTTRRAGAIAALGAFFFNAAAASRLWRDVGMSGFYVSLLLAAVVAVALRSPRLLTGRAAAVDRLFGDLSYPLYLCHYHARALVLWVAPGVSMTYPRSGGVLAVGLAVVISYLVCRVADHPLVELRNRLRMRPPLALPTGMEERTGQGGERIVPIG
jgi:peptidoglycan/LPS O-acetylase OafA/YrhL